MPLRRASGHTSFNSPAGRVRSVDIQHADNPSLHDGGGQLTRPEMISGEQRVVQTLVKRLVDKLPCNSGIKLAILENDEGIKTTVESLLQISRLQLSVVAHTLASALDTLAKLYAAVPLVDVPLDTIQSQLFILHILLMCLSESWRINTAASPYQPSELPQCWPDPAPLDDNLARHLLGILVSYTRLISQDNSGQLGIPVPLSSKDGKSASSSTVNSWNRQVSPSSTAFSLGAQFIQQHSYPAASGKAPPPVSESLLAPTASTTATAIAQVTRYTARIIFFLSASNWPLVLSRIKARVAHLTTTLEENPELIELRLLEWSNVDFSRLAQVLQDWQQPIQHVKRPAQTALANALRKAIWNWIDVYPYEYQQLIEGKRKLDSADIIFEAISGSSEASASGKRGKTYYPFLAMLLVLSPDSLRKVALGETGRTSGLSKKANFIESLRKGLTQAKSFEACVICAVDLVRAALSCSPRLEGSGIRTLLPDLHNDLKNALFYSSLTSEITDASVLVDGLVALYRYTPSLTTSLIFPKLWNDSADAYKMIGVRACTIIVTEGQRLPWYPPVHELRPDVAPSVRVILKSQTNALIGNKSKGLPIRGSIDLTGSQTDLIWEVLNLMALDPAFAFDGAGDSNDTLGQTLVVISSLTSTLCPMTIRAQAAKTNIAILERLLDSMGVDAPRAAMAANSAVPIWQILIDASRQLLVDFHMGNVSDLALIAGAFRQTVLTVWKAATTMPDIMTKAPNARAAVLVAKVATITSLIGPDVQQTNMASQSLRALSKLVLLVRSGISNSQAQLDEITDHSTMLAELASLPPATGRQLQQRAIRRVIKQHIRASTLLSTIWIGLNARATALAAKIAKAEASESNGDRDSRRRMLSADIVGLNEDESKEWQNLIAFLCSTSSVALQDNIAPVTVTDTLGKGVLPRVYEEPIDLTAHVESFIRQSVDLLISSSIHVREAAKDALGTELPLGLSRVLILQMTKLLSHAFVPGGVAASETFTIYVDQAIAVLKSTVERVSPGDNGVQVEMGELLYLIAQYTHRLGREDYQMRIKQRYCQLIEVVLNRPDFAILGNNNKLRNAVLEWMCEWSIESFRDGEGSKNLVGNDRIQRDLDHACLRAMIPVTDNLIIKPPGAESEDTQLVVKSRLFYRYYHMLVRVLERSANSAETESSHVATSVSGLSMKVSNTETYPALAIQVLSNLLSANIDVGLKHCLTLGYHDDPTIRTAFMQLISNILQQDTRFGGLATKTGITAPKAYFEALTSPNLALAMAMCDVCPPGEVDEVSLMLFRVFEAKGSLLSLMKLLIEREVSQTNHESELFRANSITTRLLTMFGRAYGYNYCRSTLQPLIHHLEEKPPECSFELDPSKVPEEEIGRNAEHLRLMCQALLEVIYTSADNAPVMFKALCHHIWDSVEDRFPDSRHSAVGSFLFLRFLCPAIVAPEAMDLDVNPDTRDTRRALLLITKVVQNLANNVLFGNKEAHMKVLNPFLSENIRQVTKFLSELAVRPRSWEVAQAIKTFQEEAERNLDTDGDNMLIQRFVFRHIARLETSLENMPQTFRGRSNDRNIRLELDGRAAAASLRLLMEETGPPVDFTRLSSNARNQVFDDFMRHNADRSTESVDGVFYEGPANQNQRRIFYFIVSRVTYIDYDLLAYHIFSKIANIAEPFDLVIDLTDFSPSTELPSAWLRRAIQMAPPSLWGHVATIALYNPNSYARKRVRRIIAELPAVGNGFTKNIVGASSPAELAEFVPFTTLMLPEHTLALAFEADHVFTNLLWLADHESQMPVVVKLGDDCLQVASWRKQDITPTVKSYIIDVVNLKDVNDVILGQGAGAGVGGGPASDQLVVKHSQNQTVTFISRKRGEMAQIIRSARSRLRESPSTEDRVLRPSDVPGTLLNVALLNLSSNDETLRMGAYGLVHELSQFFKFDLSSLVTPVSAGLLIPGNSLEFVYKLSKLLASSAPNLTLEFLKEWIIGFTKADLPQKTACLHYVPPWLANLELFAKPTRDDGVEPIKQVIEIIRNLISLTATEKKRLHLSFQEHVWSVIGKSHDALVDLVVSELLNYAFAAGPGSERAENAAEILVSLSSTAVKGKLIVRLRKTISQTYSTPTNNLTENNAWTEIIILARLNLALTFSPQSPLDTQVFLPELLFCIVLLAGVGPVLMRQTVYGLTMSIVQSLSISFSGGDMDTTTLHHLLKRLQQPEMINAFGLQQMAYNFELSGLSQNDQYGNLYLDSLDLVIKFLMDVLSAGAPTTDCANAWRARWTGLIASTAFQHNPATQSQCFLALGHLASEEADDDLVFQTLGSLRTSVHKLNETNTVHVISVLRSLTRLLPGLSRRSKYPPIFFWLAVGLMEVSYIPIFAPALELLLSTLRHMEGEGLFANGIFEYLLPVRRRYIEAARNLDQVCGVSFDTNPYFSLVAVVYKGVRHPNTRKLTIVTLTELLRLSSSIRLEPIEEDAPLIGSRSVAFFTSLLPIAAAQASDLKGLFTAAGVDVAEEELRDLSTLSVFDLLSIPDNSTALLLVTLIVTMLHSASTDTERLVLYRLLAEASIEMPDVVALAYDSLIPRMAGVMGSTSSTAILSAVTVIMERAMADASYSFAPVPIAGNESTQSLHQKNFSTSINNSAAPMPVVTPHGTREQVLDDLGMRGLNDMSFQPGSADRLTGIGNWVGQLIEAICEVPK
ncbi:Neurofibromin [Vanrija pseudolonga]|uniref:Neurofibromin n=1 Tax=Vanrija pseudolonga TaxID=143232 RepID=A0AAF0YB70_9TREE|nr:Neurofibromin [Vanrija pseudolonga]